MRFEVAGDGVVQPLAARAAWGDIVRGHQALTSGAAALQAFDQRAEGAVVGMPGGGGPEPGKQSPGLGLPFEERLPDPGVAVQAEQESTSGVVDRWSEVRLEQFQSFAPADENPFLPAPDQILKTARPFAHMRPLRKHRITDHLIRRPRKSRTVWNTTDG